MTYATGHVKHDPANNQTAIRTAFPDDGHPQLAALAWLVATTNQGARTTSTAEVEAWSDLYTPPADE